MTTSSSHASRGARLAVIGLLANVGLAIVKLLAGLLGNSYALVADAVESMADIFASVVVWGGLRIAARNPDDDHPYGHGKAEALAALIVSLMLIAAAIGIAIEAVREILIPHHVPAAYTLWVLLAVVVTKELLFRFVARAASDTGSTAVTADAWHHRSDAITSVSAFAGISIALWGGQPYAPADDWAALLASGVIFYNAVRLMRAPLHELMDAAQDDLVDQVREVSIRTPAVAGVEKILARKSGSHYWVDLHLEVDPAMSVRDAHGVAHQVKDAIRRSLPQVRDVLVHVEPHGPKNVPA
ncbi:MAG: cation diffusion facilitator family transporter [Phycisphaerae bacterium]